MPWIGTINKEGIMSWKTSTEIDWPDLMSRTLTMPEDQMADFKGISWAILMHLLNGWDAIMVIFSERRDPDHVTMVNPPGVDVSEILDAIASVDWQPGGVNLKPPGPEVHKFRRSKPRRKKR